MPETLFIDLCCPSLNAVLEKVRDFLPKIQEANENITEEDRMCIGIEENDDEKENENENEQQTSSCIKMV